MLKILFPLGRRLLVSIKKNVQIHISFTYILCDFVKLKLKTKKETMRSAVLKKQLHVCDVNNCSRRTMFAEVKYGHNLSCSCQHRLPI